MLSLFLTHFLYTYTSPLLSPIVPFRPYSLCPTIIPQVSLSETRVVGCTTFALRSMIWTQLLANWVTSRFAWLALNHVQEPTARMSFSFTPKTARVYLWSYSRPSVPCTDSYEVSSETKLRCFLHVYFVAAVWTECDRILQRVFRCGEGLLQAGWH